MSDPKKSFIHRRAINAPDAPSPLGGYAQGVEIADAARTLYLSGQIPAPRDGLVPATFREQCELAWRNLEAQLRAADMTFDNLVKVTTFLADRRFGDENGAVELLSGLRDLLHEPDAMGLLGVEFVTR